MKRGGSISNEPDKKRPAVSAVVTAGADNVNERATVSSLNELADELLLKVYSFISFKDRQITRRVSRRLLGFVDESTPGADQLSIKVEPMWQLRHSAPFIICMQPDAFKPESMVRVEVSLDTEASINLQKLLSSLPPLRSIRPKALFLEVEFYLYSNTGMPRGFFAGLMQKLIEQQVPRSVTEVCLSYLPRNEQGPQVQQAFLAFENLSRDGVQRLMLFDYSATNILLPTAAQFTRLVSLAVDLDSDSEADLEALASLSDHPSLRELKVIIDSDYDPFNLMTSLAAFRNIRNLDLDCYCYLWEGEDDNSEVLFSAFGNMIRGMENLECLCTLYSPSVQFWQYLAGNNVVSSRLGKLEINYGDDATVEKLDAMMQGLQTFAPSLTTFRLVIVDSDELDDWDDSQWEVGMLSRLRQHPTLSALVLESEFDFGHETLSNLQQGLGKKIKLSSVGLDVVPY